MALEGRVEAAIAEAIREGDMGPDTAGVAGPWLLLAVTYDSAGQRGMSLTTAGDQPLDATLGLLDVARVVYQEEARQWVMGSGEG